MRGRGGVPRQRLARALRALARRSELAGIVEELGERAAEARDVAGRHDPARGEARDDLAEPADVVDDRGDACAQRLEQRAGLVELVAVGEDRDGRLGERLLELAWGRGSRAATRRGRRRARGAPRAGCAGRLRRAGARPARRARRSIASGRPLYGRITPGARTVVPSSARDGSLRNTGWGITRSASGATPKRDERVAAALRVDDDAVEPSEEASPEPRSAGACGAAAGRAR